MVVHSWPSVLDHALCCTPSRFISSMHFDLSSRMNFNLVADSLCSSSYTPLGFFRCVQLLSSHGYVNRSSTLHSSFAQPEAAVPTLLCSHLVPGLRTGRRWICYRP